MASKIFYAVLILGFASVCFAQDAEVCDVSDCKEKEGFDYSKFEIPEDADKEATCKVYHDYFECAKDKVENCDQSALKLPELKEKWEAAECSGAASVHFSIALVASVIAAALFF